MAVSAKSSWKNSAFAPQSSTTNRISLAVRCQLTGVKYRPERIAAHQISPNSAMLGRTTATPSPGPMPSPASAWAIWLDRAFSSAYVTVGPNSPTMNAARSGYFSAITPMYMLAPSPEWVFLHVPGSPRPEHRPAVCAVCPTPSSQNKKSAELFLETREL